MSWQSTRGLVSESTHAKSPVALPSDSRFRQDGLLIWRGFMPIQQRHIGGPTAAARLVDRKLVRF
jgi:hypothetical protein